MNDGLQARLGPKVQQAQAVASRGEGQQPSPKPLSNRLGTQPGVQSRLGANQALGKGHRQQMQVRHTDQIGMPCSVCNVRALLHTYPYVWPAVWLLFCHPDRIFSASIVLLARAVLLTLVGRTKMRAVS